jgi:pyrimidine-nucleoside phosphorylase
MNIIDIINKKANKEMITKEEIEYVINSFVNGDIKDYQMSALLMAIKLNGMNFDETYYLTNAMLNSGGKVDLSNINGDIIDKHSTGGVGDKTTLILAPILACLGFKVAKMSGRGLGHTGGTIDKLESIEGFKVELDPIDFVKQVNEVGVAVISQSGNIVPADKKIYALRDVTGTTESIPLIASSIMSKKIASGSNYIIIDLKVGNGALMKTIEDARTLAKTMIEIGKRFNKKVVCVLTDMNEPLGYTIGNGLEVKESINFLNGIQEANLKELIETLTYIALKFKKDIQQDEVKQLINDIILNKTALNKMTEWITYQHGNINNIKTSSKVISIKSNKEGFIHTINALKLGELARMLGAGRINKEDIIDLGVGFELSKKVGDLVSLNEELLKVYYNEKEVKVEDILSCFEIKEEPIAKTKIILEVIE